MLRFIIDEHIPHSVAAGLKLRQPKVVVFDLPSWNNGSYLGADDEVLLSAAHEHGLTLITFDVSTIPDVLITWAEANRDHSGVVFINSGSFRSNRVGELVMALEDLWLAERDFDWTNRIVFLKRRDK